ncbi:MULTISPECIES: helix-turn-helix domain-containing protein [Olivibacter]|uniref:Helix-turn-helix domain-containing protein n=1 Tax=Olivibacter jilunii TaxID=985016 RepID=A0ABW6B5H1_9SPHI
MLTNFNIEISDLLGSEGTALEDRIMACRNTEERVGTMTSFLAKKLKDDVKFNKDMIATVNFITHHNGNVDMLGLANQNFLSQRQFERKFKSLIGFSPKMFSRIVRFEACLSNTVSKSQSLVQLSLDSGYYDQPHMIRDFKEFSGKHPRRYLIENHSSVFE